MHGVARSFALLSVGGLMLCATMAGGALAQDDAQAKEILKVAGIQSGLCVHLGSGAQRSAGLTAALAANSNMLVHGLALDVASLERARKAAEAKCKLPAGINSPGCTPSAIAGNGRLVSDTRGGGYIDMAPASDDPAKPKGSQHVAYRAMRGACIQGATPAYGIYYTGQNWCRCTPGQVPGFVAVGPNGEPPAPAYFETGRPVEKGPAFGEVKPSAPADTDWPMLRHDATRGGATKTKVPQDLKALWRGEATKPPEGPLAGAWGSRLASCLTAPVAAEGKVFAAATEAGQIVALDPATGKPAWRFTAGGRIDSPPSLYHGLCLFGCHDGWIYALRASDGRLVWRTRAAPWERRMVAFGQVESIWPAVGSVLVHEDVVYASAGRTSESDGGIAISAINPATGEQLWGRAITPGPGRENDLLLAAGKTASCAYRTHTSRRDGPQGQW